MDETGRVSSSDGTSIAFERQGAGPALIVVDPAGSYRDFRPQRPPVERLAAAGRRREAVEFFHRGIGVPEEIMEQMAPPTWAALEAVAHTLVYDCVISDATSLGLLRSVPIPTLVLDSQGTTGELPAMAATVVQALPRASYRGLPGGRHGVSDEVLAPTLVEFFSGRNEA